MKIAFVGKGGSGKTTLSALFSRYIASLQLPILAIDADINQHLAEALGMSRAEAKQLIPMGLEIDRIKEYLRGDNVLIPSNKEMIKTSPPGKGSRLLTLTEENSIYTYFQKEIQGVKIMTTGAFDESDLGVKCYHSKVGAVELLLNHLTDKEKEYVVVDMTAGADSFASGMFTRFDITFVVVEPTIKALGVYEQYKHYTKDYGVLLKVIGNKIETEDDLGFIKEKVGHDFLTAFNRSEYVKKMEKGVYFTLNHLERQNVQALKLMLDSVGNCKKDWDKYYKHMVEFHIKNGKSWANAQLGINAEKQIDSEFRFQL